VLERQGAGVCEIQIAGPAFGGFGRCSKSMGVPAAARPSRQIIWESRVIILRRHGHHAAHQLGWSMSSISMSWFPTCPSGIFAGHRSGCVPGTDLQFAVVIAIMSLSQQMGIPIRSFWLPTPPARSYCSCPTGGATLMRLNYCEHKFVSAAGRVGGSQTNWVKLGLRNLTAISGTDVPFSTIFRPAPARCSRFCWRPASARPETDDAIQRPQRATTNVVDARPQHAADQKKKKKKQKKKKKKKTKKNSNGPNAVA